MFRNTIAFASIPALMLSLVACSSSSTTPSSDAGTGSDSPVAMGDGGGGGGEGGATMVTQKGKIVDLGGSSGIKGAMVDLGGHSAVTMDSPNKGGYAIQIPANSPFYMTVTEPSHVKLIEQEYMVTADLDRGNTSLVPTSIESALTGGLPGYDSTKGVLAVGIFKKGACADEAGAVIALDPPGATKVVYFKGGFPDGNSTSVQSGQTTPSAVIYNIDPAGGLKVKVTPPASCAQIPFPYSDGAITYTGGAKVEAGNTTSFIRIFVQ